MWKKTQNVLRWDIRIDDWIGYYAHNIFLWKLKVPDNRAYPSPPPPPPPNKLRNAKNLNFDLKQFWN